MGAIKMFTGLVMASLFAIALIGFSTNFAANQNSPISVSNDSSITGLNTQLGGGQTEFYTQANSSAATFMSTTQDKGDQSATSGGQFKAGLGEIINSAGNILNSGFSAIFGQDRGGFGIFLTAILAILAFMAAGYGWKYLRGNPD